MKISNKPLAFIRLTLTAVFFFAIPQIVWAQSNYKLGESSDGSIKVLGSSNVHDWTMASSTMQSQGNFSFSGGKFTALLSLNFQVAFKSLKSDHSSMDNRTYKAVNESKFPNITYRLTSAVVTPAEKGKYLIKAKGDLTIAGVTKSINLDVTAITDAANTITCNGSEKIQLTDYGIKPPSYMLGAMKVYNDLTIQFNLIYTKKS